MLRSVSENKKMRDLGAKMPKIHYINITIYNTYSKVSNNRGFE